MASEAQRLIGISLSKIAQSRSHRGGISLHRNLLVATVLQKARYIFMEEAYNMHYHVPVPVQQAPVRAEENLVGLTVEEAGLESNGLPDQFQQQQTPPEDPTIQQQSCIKCTENQQQDKENHPPGGGELTYIDLDKTSNNMVRERNSSSSLKRRRAVSEWETEEAVQSILPKKIRQDDEVSEVSSENGSSGDSAANDDSVFLDDATLLSDIVSKEVEEAERSQETTASAATNGCGSAMEIDRITSLVSIFSFSMSSADNGKLNRSVSTPDLCSAQAKDCPDSLQQRPFLAMTV